MSIDELHHLVASIVGPMTARQDSHVLCQAPTRIYRNPEGKHELVFHLEIAESPAPGMTKLIIKVFPFMEITETKHREQLLIACMFLQCYPRTVVQFELLEDIIGLDVKLPLLDNRVTAAQLMYCLNDLNTVAESQYELLCSIMKTGKFDALKATLNHLPDVTSQWLTHCEPGNTDWV